MQGHRRPPAWTRSKNLAELAEHVRRDASGQEPWPDPVVVSALAEGKSSGGVATLVMAGKLLRARDTRPELRRELRAALPDVFRNTGAATVQDSITRLSAELTELLGDLESRCDHQEGVAPDCVLALALLRDDLEATRHALAGVRLLSSAAGRDLLDPLVWMLEEARAVADRLDDAVSPMLPRLRRILRESAVAAPPELLAMVSAGSNPWWLDLVDPALATSPTQYESRAAALAADGVLEAREVDRERSATANYLARGVLENGAGRLEFYADACGALWTSLHSELLSGVEVVELVWSDAGETNSTQLGRIAAGEWEAEIARAALLAGRKGELGMRAGDRTWLVIEWDDPSGGV